MCGRVFFLLFDRTCYRVMWVSVAFTLKRVIKINLLHESDISQCSSVGLLIFHIIFISKMSDAFFFFLSWRTIICKPQRYSANSDYEIKPQQIPTFGKREAFDMLKKMSVECKSKYTLMTLLKSQRRTEMSLWSHSLKYFSLFEQFFFPFC